MGIVARAHGRPASDARSPHEGRAEAGRLRVAGRPAREVNEPIGKGGPPARIVVAALELCVRDRLAFVHEDIPHVPYAPQERDGPAPDDHGLVRSGLEIETEGESRRARELLHEGYGRLPRELKRAGLDEKALARVSRRPCGVTSSASMAPTLGSVRPLSKSGSLVRSSTSHVCDPRPGAAPKKKTTRSRPTPAQGDDPEPGQRPVIVVPQARRG